MFNFLTDAVENALNVTGAVLSGEDISSRQVARLISDGMSIAAIAAMFGVGADVIQKMIDEE